MVFVQMYINQQMFLNQLKLNYLEQNNMIILYIGQIEILEENNQLKQFLHSMSLLNH
jgi:hypothetical protein